MANAIEKKIGSAAWLLASPFGARIALAPESGTGAGGSGEGGGGGSGDEKKPEGQGEGQAGKSAGDDKAGDRSQQRGNLFDRRKTSGGDDQRSGDGGDKGGDDGRPAWCPEKFWDAEAKQVRSEALAKAYGDAETNLGKLKRDKGGGGEVPEKPDGYFPEGLPMPEGVDRFDAIAVDDPGLQAWAKTAHKYGIGRELAHNLARDMFASMNEFAPVPIDPEEEYKALGANADAIIEGVWTWVEGNERSGVFSAEDVDIADSLAKTANGLNFLAKARAMSGERPLPRIPANGSAMSPEAWNEAYKAAVKSKDYREQERLDALSSQLWPDGIPRGAIRADSEAPIARRRS